MVILGIVAYLGTHPRLLAPFASRLISQNLLHDWNGNLKVGDFRWHPFGGIDLYRVSATLHGEGQGVTLIAVDTLSVAYRFGELFGSPPRLRRLLIKGGEVYSLQGSGGSGGDGAPRRWPRLRLDQLEILGCSVEVSGPDGRLRERISGINWRGVVAADTLLDLDCRDAACDWETRNSRLSGVWGKAALDSSGVRFRGLHCRLNDSKVVLEGRREWQGQLDLAVQAEAVVATEIEDLLNLTLGFTAVGDLDATFRSSGDSLLYRGEFTGELEGYRFEGVGGRAVLSAGSLLWDELYGRINSAYFAGRGEFDISDPQAVSYRLTGQVADVDLAQGLVPGEELPASQGRGQMILLHDEAPLRTRVTAVLTEGHVAEIPFDTLWVDVQADSTGVAFDRLDLDFQGQKAWVTGHSDTSRFFRGDLSLDVPELARLPEQWNLPRIGGSLSAGGELSGRSDALTFAGQVSGRDFRLPPLGVGSKRVALVVCEVVGDPLACLEVGGEDLTLGGVSLGQFQLRGRLAADGARVESFRSQRGDTLLVLNGRAVFGDSVSTIRVEAFAVDLEGNHWRMAGPTHLTFGADGVSLPAFFLASEYGELAVQDYQQNEQELAGSLQLTRFDLGLVNPFLPGSVRLGGEGTATLLLGGTPAEPQVNLVADLTGCDLDPARIDSLHVEALYRQGSLAVNQLWLASDRGLLSCSGTVTHPGAGFDDFWPGAELDLSLSIQEGDWAFCDRFAIPALDRLAGCFETSLQIGGTTREPQIVGRLSSAPFNVHWLQLESLAGRVLVDRDQLVLSGLVGRQGPLEVSGRLEVPLAFDLLSSPVTPPEAPFLMHLVVAAESDLAPLARATNAFIECGGRGEGEITVAGPLEHPLWEGNLQVRDASFVLKGLGEIYHGVSLDGTFSGDELILDRIVGGEGALGTIQGDGRVRFRGLALESFAVDLDVDRFLVASIPDLRALVRSPHLLLTGVRVGPDSLVVPKFSGRLDVIEARYTGDFAERPGVSDPRAATVAPDWLADIQLVAPPRSVRVVNRAMELFVSGDADLIRDEEGLYLRGSANIDAGHLPVFNNDFKVVRGGLDFSQEVGLTPRVDIEAETTVRVRSATYGNSSALERITVLVTGTLDAPVISFRSESGYPREGIERMLLGLSPHVDDPRVGGGFRDASISAGFNLLEREIAAGLDLVDTFDIEQIEREQVDGSGTLAPLIGVGKYLGRDLYIKYAQGLSQADRDLLIEYQINDHLLLQSEIRRRVDELQGDSTYTLDLKYRFAY